MREPDLEPVNLRDLLDATLDVLGALVLVGILIFLSVEIADILHGMHS